MGCLVGVPNNHGGMYRYAGWGFLPEWIQNLIKFALTVFHLPDFDLGIFSEKMPDLLRPLTWSPQPPPRKTMSQCHLRTPAIFILTHVAGKNIYDFRINPFTLLRPNGPLPSGSNTAVLYPTSALPPSRNLQLCRGFLCIKTLFQSLAFKLKWVQQDLSSEKVFYQLSNWPCQYPCPRQHFIQLTTDLKLSMEFLYYSTMCTTRNCSNKYLRNFGHCSNITHPILPLEKANSTTLTAEGVTAIGALTQQPSDR